MKIEVNEHGTIVLKEVFNPIKLVTADNETLIITMRDSGFEVCYENDELKQGKVLADSGFVSGSCKGEVCSVCGKPATNKLEETIFWDDPNKMRHPLTAYVCREHFRMIVGG